jgi:hypothetical protein
VSRKQPSWLRLSLNLWQASLEAQQVIGLRLAMLMSGSQAAPAELSRMVPEKIAAAFEAQQAAANAALTGNAALIPSRTIALYRRKMRANRKRLSGVKSPSAPLTGRCPKSRPK